MPRRVQIVRHGTNASNAFTGREGELTVDTGNDELRVHDGATAGGHRMAKRVDVLLKSVATTANRFLFTSGANTVVERSVTQLLDDFATGFNTTTNDANRIDYDNLKDKPNLTTKADTNLQNISSSLTTAQRLTVQSRLTPSVASLTDASSIAWNVGTSPFAKVTLAGNRTLANATNAVEGGIYTLAVTQDGTGGRTLTLGNNYHDGDRLQIISTANSTTLLIFYYFGTNMRLVSALDIND